MAVWSQISTSDLVGAVRLDAEFWQPSYLEKRENNPYKRICLSW